MNTFSPTACIARHAKTLGLGAVLGLALGTPAYADVDIANIPLFLTARVDPNLMFILDDSGSMQFEIMPDEYNYWNISNGSVIFVYPRADGVYGGGDYNNRVATVDDHAYNAIARSPQVNTVYYNPSVTYTPWSRYDSSLYPNASLTCALHNPERSGTGAAYCRDFTVDNSNYNSTRWSTCNSDGSCSSTTATKTFWPATYFWHNGGSVWDFANYTRVEIRSTTASYTGHGRASRTDCAAAPTCTYAEEIQNFANWYTYYRSRVLAARAGIGKAFSQQGEGMRVGFGAINKDSSSVDGVSTGTIIRGVRPFSGTNRQSFFESLYGHTIPNSGTPLREALDDAGQYFSRTDNPGPWGANPGTNDSSSHLQCRQNFTILMTDGYWTEGSDYQADTDGARDNNDGSAGSTITGPNSQSFTYAAVSPFTDAYSNTLADVAMYYWKRDLRTLANEVPTTPANPAFWQHMVTFGVGMGVTGSVSPTAAFQAITSGAAVAWPDPTSSEAAKIDDLLHASVNSRGGFFSAADPKTFADELSDVLSTIVARVESSSTAAAASSASLQSDTRLYTAGFRSTDWSGQLLARHLVRDADGNLLLGSTAWDAEARLREQVTNGTRNIFTSAREAVSTGSTQTLAAGGVSLQGTLHANQQAALNHAPDGTLDSLGVNRINWLYGNESAHASFRNRSGSGDARLLGDIVNSNPQFAGKRDFGYRRLSDHGASYLTYFTGVVQSRPDMLYVGANDGMLHAFDAQSGMERFAYMPSELLLPDSGASYARINRLMEQNYNHRYLMDGTATVADVYIGGWKSVLVGTMGAGGRTVFALDVSNPAGFGASNVLWEFTDPDLGYGVGKPTIVRMSNGVWAAVFGNGYNSASHKAVLFIVSLSDGQLLAKVNTNNAADTAASPNGLAAPTAALRLDTMSATTIYAGDLKGRLWRFDVTENLSTWDNSSKRTVLFQARDAGNAPQPITSAPEVALNPNDPGTLIVAFGTGSYFRAGDADSLQVQSLYGIIDDDGAAVSGRAELIGQSITWQGPFTVGGATYTLREISDNNIGDRSGWYLDLVYGNNANGERVVSKPTLLTGAVRDRVRFTTMIPEPDPCGTSGGRTGFLMDIMLGSGGRAPRAVFDLNNDGEFNGEDIPDSCEGSCSGLDFGGGEEVIVIQDGDNTAQVLDGEGDAVRTDNPGTPTGRQSWRQLR